MSDHEGEGPKRASPAQNSLSDPAGLKDWGVVAPAGATKGTAPPLPADALATHRFLIYHVSAIP